MPPSFPRASKVANDGSSPVRTLEFAGPLLLTFVNTQKALTFPANLERPAIRHLHRQALRPGRRGDAERETQQQQRETLHTRTPPWELSCLLPARLASHLRLSCD